MINNFKGFTLIEVIITISILAIIGSISAGILTRSYTSSNKSNLVGKVKQNGQNIINTMEKEIRGSERVVCPDSAPFTGAQTLVLQKYDGSLVRFFINGPTAYLNGFINQDTPALNPSWDSSNVCTRLDCTGATCSSNPITDTDIYGGTSVTSGSFDVYKSSGFSDAVTIKFSLTNGIGSLKGYENQVAPINFTTTTQVR